MPQGRAYTAYTCANGIAVITIDHPPVNAMGQAVRAELLSHLNTALANPALRAIVISGQGRMFSAGVDITEFDGPMLAPDLNTLIDAIEASPKPVIAGLFGTAFGGGLELALGCHYRVATSGTRLGLPEVKLGLLPGAGGTQRLPRAIGPEKALAMILSGAPVAVETALADGLVDAIVEDPIAGAIAFAQKIIAQTRPIPHLRERTDKIAAARENPATFEAAAQAALEKSPDMAAQAACIAALRNAFTLPFADGLKAERALFMALVTGEQSRAQRYLFFAERQAAKLTDAPGHPPAEIAKAAVIGGGTMGSGIAMCFANAGIPVTLIEADAKSLVKALARIKATYQASAARGQLGAAAMAERLARITGATAWEPIADADLIIEAVFENLDLKKQIFTKLDRLAKPGALLATDTSTLDLDAIAGASARPAYVIGMHFFSPANVMKLLEIVRGAQTSPQSIATAIAIGKRLGKIPVVVANGDGFVANRMLARRTAEAERLLLEGAAPPDVDAIVRKFGFPMGPFAMADLAGLDVGRRIRQHRGELAPVSDALCAQGRFGQKTGAGYYLYMNGARIPVADPRVTALAQQEAAKRGIPRREVSEQEIVERMTYPLINEAARILEAGIATRASDIDVIWTSGFGWPAWRGGPCFYADQIGIPKICDALDHYAARAGDPLLAPAPLLRRLAATGGRLGVLLPSA